MRTREAFRDADHLPHLTAALDAAGVGFGMCHTEYAVTRDGPRVIEINYRLIGDNCDFLLADLLGVPLHQWILRVHAGEPLSAFDFGALRAAYGSVVSLVAERSGTVTTAPPDLSPPPTDGGVRLWHRALRGIGDHVEVTGTNRDYLGLLRAAGPDRASVDAAVDAFKKEHPWVLT
jgi:biotin carboxylase